MNLNQVRKDYETQAEGVRPLSEEAYEILFAVSRGINHTIQEVLSLTGIDNANTTVTDLPSGVLGQYEIGGDKISVEEGIIQDREMLKHVLLHESRHKQNKEKGDDEVIFDVGFEEALTETSTSMTTGQVLAYQEEMWKLNRVSTSTGISKEELVQKFEKGENEELNLLYFLTFN